MNKISWLLVQFSFPLLQFHNLSLTINFAFGSLVMNFKVSRDVIFNMEVFTYEYFSSLRMRDVSQLSDTLRFFTLFPLIDQQAYLSIWQIKVLHTYSIIRLTRISCTKNMECEWGDQIFSFFMTTIFQLEPWIGWSLDSHLFTVKETGLFQQSKNTKAFIRQNCKVQWLLSTWSGQVLSFFFLHVTPTCTDVKLYFHYDVNYKNLWN